RHGLKQCFIVARNVVADGEDIARVRSWCLRGVKFGIDMCRNEFHMRLGFVMCADMGDLLGTQSENGGDARNDQSQEQVAKPRLAAYPDIDDDDGGSEEEQVLEKRQEESAGFEIGKHDIRPRPAQEDLEGPKRIDRLEH